MCAHFFLFDGKKVNFPNDRQCRVNVIRMRPLTAYLIESFFHIKLSKFILILFADTSTVVCVRIEFGSGSMAHQVAEIHFFLRFFPFSSTIIAFEAAV